MQITINGISIYYEMTKCENSSNWVLFLHGFGGSVTSFKGLQNALCKQVNTINLDIPSSSRSGQVPAYFNIYDYAELIKNFLDALGIKKTSVVAHSFGGRIALILAAGYVSAFDKLVLIDSAGIKPRFNLWVFVKIRWYKLLKILAQKNLIDESVLKKYGSSDYKRLSSAQKQVFRRVIGEDLTYLLKDIKQPTLLIWGQKDKDTPLYMAKILHKKIYDSALIVLRGAGHFSYVDKFAQVGAILQHFFKE